MKYYFYFFTAEKQFTLLHPATTNHMGGPFVNWISFARLKHPPPITPCSLVPSVSIGLQFVSSFLKSMVIFRNFIFFPFLSLSIVADRPSWFLPQRRGQPTWLQLVAVGVQPRPRKRLLYRELGQPKLRVPRGPLRRPEGVRQRVMHGLREYHLSAHGVFHRSRKPFPGQIHTLHRGYFPLLREEAKVRKTAQKMGISSRQRTRWYFAVNVLFFFFFFSSILKGIED